MKKILIISFSNIKSDPRVRRQIDTLKEDFKLSVLGFGDFFDNDVDFISVAGPQKRKNKYLDAAQLFLGFFDLYYFRITYVVEAYSKLRGKKFDVIVANDIDSLPLVKKCFPSTPLWYDAHEYSPKQHEDDFKWRIFFKRFYFFLCKKYMPQANIVTTVCDGIAHEYSKLLGIDVKTIQNVPNYEKLNPSSGDSTSIKMIHHGGAIRSRKLEFMIEVVEKLDERFQLYLMLVPTDPVYLQELKELSKNCSRIFFVKPVEMKVISKEINKYDLGLYFLPPSNFNQELALPNKLFEFIQARLGIIIGPSREMAKVVKKYKLGIVTGDFNIEKIVSELNRIKIKDVIQYKNATNECAAVLSFENEKIKIIEIVSQLTRGAI